jgi:RHS repeat-associated protein
MPMKARYTVVNGEIIAEKRNGVRKLYVPDALGSTVALLDNTQTPTDTFTYWRYGEVNTRTGTTATPFQFVGTQGYHSDTSGKTYVRARYLDSQKVRWLTEDPIGLSGAGWSVYVYAGNNPTAWTDPGGLRPTKDYGDSFCRRWFGSGSHSCSTGAWPNCITTCKGYHKVDYCCNTTGCHCLPQPPRKPPSKPPQCPPLTVTDPLGPWRNPFPGILMPLPEPRYDPPPMPELRPRPTRGPHGCSPDEIWNSQLQECVPVDPRRRRLIGLPPLPGTG